MVNVTLMCIFVTETLKIGIMKNYNEEHEATIISHSVPEKKAENKELVNHSQLVTGISFYAALPDGNYTKVWLDRSFITDLDKQINQIESISTLEEYFDLPF